MDLVVDRMTFTGVAPGRRSLEGLDWLGRVGASPVEPWRLVMGWSERVARDHVQRLEAAGLVERVAMRRGHGVLVVASSRGAIEAGYLASWAPRSIGPSTWAHACGCAWASAWLELRGRAWWSERQVKDSDFWRREATYRDRRGTARVTHRPDLGFASTASPPRLRSSCNASHAPGCSAFSRCTRSSPTARTRRSPGCSTSPATTTSPASFDGSPGPPASTARGSQCGHSG